MNLLAYACEPTILVPLASLAWFLVGLLCGKTLWKTVSRTAKRSRRRSGGSKPKSGSGAPELYVGNLSYDVGDKDLFRAFGEFGRVASVRIIKNRFNDKSKGYAFVCMGDDAQNNKAMQAMNGKTFKGRKMVVNVAKNKTR